jgi:hypothetical protein
MIRDGQPPSQQSGAPSDAVELIVIDQDDRTSFDSAISGQQLLQAEPDVDASDKLEEVHETLAHASDALDEERDDEEDPGGPF